MRAVWYAVMLLAGVGVFSLAGLPIQSWKYWALIICLAAFGIANGKIDP